RGARTAAAGRLWPCGHSWVRRRSRCRVFVEPPEQRLDACGVLHRAVSPKVELRRDPEVEVMAEPLADEAPGAPERGQRRRPLVLVAEDRDKEIGRAHV